MADPNKNRFNFEYEQLKKLKNDSGFFDFEVLEKFPGEPPHKYRAKFTCKGIIGINGRREPQYGFRHDVIIYLPNEYPTAVPLLTWETPIWHPNINSESTKVCIDEVYWYGAGSRSLYDLCVMLGEMIMYKSFHYDFNKPPFPLPESKKASEWCAWAVANRVIPPPGQQGIDPREFLSPRKAPAIYDGDQDLPAPAAGMASAPPIRKIRWDEPKGVEKRGIKFTDA